MTDYQSPAAIVRSNLRTEMGLTSRQVSVRSYGGSISVTIKAPGIKIADVEAIAERQEVIRRDHRTGDILRGGNTFVNVSLDSKLIEGPAAQILPWLESLKAGDDGHQVPKLSNLTITIPTYDPNTLTLWDGENYVTRGNVHGIADVIAARLVEAGI